MEMSACSKCGEVVSPEWTVCPLCTQPTKKSVGGLCCLQCNGNIQADHLLCPHCHVPIIRRYCAGCERLIPDHAEFCPLCGASRLQKRSLRKIVRAGASIAAAGLMIAAVIYFLPGNSATKVPVQEQKASAQPQPFSEPVAESKSPEPKLNSTTPVPSEDLVPATNIVEAPQEAEVQPVSLPESKPQTPLNPADLLQRGARLKAGRKLSELGSLYIRKRKFKEAAIVLRQAVDAFPPETRDVTYGESLYHLGYSLRMSGKPAEAIPVLKLALNFPLYSTKVQKELKTASAEMKKSR